ncbi:alpha/beta fold hydrolase [Nocardia caishijiensis]|uniref:Pimeloyl-ACP methyl ester carboxylesterase n=1 Tax=Nocardia caishijiensis TaxID=184756 RepID=A0ABQ6YSV6_9NOCA|nr:alpha/beta hydrolase [Nocardia caishijiensis]KAF0848491.1 pimeloyl-ACP methyl ester carboxylesterase [Nocardia caishijiensis]
MATHDRPFHQGPFDDLPAHPNRPHAFLDLPAKELSMRSTRYGRQRIRYRDTGTGPPLLLVHGLMTTSYSWRYVMARLGEHFRVVAVDLPGCGNSEAPPDATFRGAEIGEWLAEFQRALGIEGCAAVGNSMGGLPLLHRVLEDPTAFEKVAILHSPLLPEFKHRALAVVLALPGVRSGLAAYVRRQPYRWAHHRTHYFDETVKSLEEAGEYGSPLATSAGSRAFVSHLRDGLHPRDLTALARRLAALDEFPVPLLAVYGTEPDPIVPPQVAVTFARHLPTARMVRIDRASHFVHVDRPDTVADTIIEFLCAEQGSADNPCHRPLQRDGSPDNRT